MIDSSIQGVISNSFIRVLRVIPRRGVLSPRGNTIVSLYSTYCNEA